MNGDVGNQRRRLANVAQLDECTTLLKRFGATEDGCLAARTVVAEAFAMGLGGEAERPFNAERQRLHLVARLLHDQAKRLPKDRLGRSRAQHALDELCVAVEMLKRFDQSLKNQPDAAWLDVALISLGVLRERIDSFLASVEQGRRHGEKPGSRGWEARKLLAVKPETTVRELTNRGSRSLTDRRYAQRLRAKSVKSLTK